MFKYKINPIYEIIPLEIKIENVPLNEKGFAEILSINLEHSYKLNRAKNRINNIDSTKWEEIKKITTPYEFIHAFNPKSKYNDSRSVALIKPLSRSFFKMIEMIYEFCPDIIQSKDAIITTHIAEGPGGFIEAVRYVRKGKYDDYAFGMTLVKYDKNEYKNVHIPGWNKSNQFLYNNPEVHIINGSDGTGDIYKTNNIKYLNEKVRKISSNGSDLITADGGFDFSVEYNYQEQSSCKLIFSQILGALQCQKQGGTFICKFFDFNSYFTVEMLYLLYTVYESITIYKPYTSRIANSEKYIICSGFKGIETSLSNTSLSNTSLSNKSLSNTSLSKLFEVLEQWNKYKIQTINYIFEKIPVEFIEKIKAINAEIIDYQVSSINTAIDIIRTNKIDNNKKWYDSTIEIHIQKAREWCKKYNIPCRI